MKENNQLGPLKRSNALDLSSSRSGPLGQSEQKGGKSLSQRWRAGQHNSKKQAKPGKKSANRTLSSDGNTLTMDGGNTLDAATSLGTVAGYYSLKGTVGAADPVDYYQFNLGSADLLSVFLDGLSAGNTIDLLDSNGTVLKSATNSGTTWDAANSTKTGGTLTASLAAGTYYVRVTPSNITGNSRYAKSEYQLNFQPHNAPNTITVAAQDSEFASSADFRATGSSDQTVINQAIASMGNRGGGTIVLMEGTYNISNNVLITYDNITLTGVGWSTILKLTPNANLRDAGLLRSAYKSQADNLRKPRFFNQHFRHMSLDGNKDQGTDYDDSYGNYGTYMDSSFDDLRIHDFPHYGFDPHENYYSGTPTVRLTIQNSLADHNKVDGITTDNCLSSTIVGNISDSNGRHGINIVTASSSNLFEDNISSSNGSSGITMQPGGDRSRTSDSNILRNNSVFSNAREGIHVYRSNDSELLSNHIFDNGHHGIRFRGTSFSLVQNNLVENNGQVQNDKYTGIYMDNDTILYSTNNQIRNNTVRSTTAIRHRYGMGEKNALDDYNAYVDNTSVGHVRRAIYKLGPNSTISP